MKKMVRNKKKMKIVVNPTGVNPLKGKDVDKEEGFSTGNEENGDKWRKK